MPSLTNQIKNRPTFTCQKTLDTKIISFFTCLIYSLPNYTKAIVLTKDNVELKVNNPVEHILIKSLYS